MPDNDSALFHIPHLLHSEGIRLKKRYGQHVLANWKTLKAIVARCTIERDMTVIEIGAGIGNLTRLLAERAAKVYAIERDRDFAPLHARHFAAFPNVEFLYEDVLDLDFHKLVSSQPERTVVVGNIPYQITSPIIMKLLEDEIHYGRVLLMMQREVAERLTASPGGKQFGILTLKVLFYSDVRIEFLIPPKRFIPPPRVESALVRFFPHKKVHFPDNAQRKRFFALIDSAFSQRRKTLANAVSHALAESLNKQRVTSALAELGISPQSRAESLSLEQFFQLYEKLSL
jgi:16S rRNA (adenine1518-N6/adenine1519-N6)-dimethyltransferase